MYTVKDSDGCDILGTCYGATPVPSGVFHGDSPLDHVLTNRGALEIEFKLTYPMPCIGTFDEGSIYVFGKVI